MGAPIRKGISWRPSSTTLRCDPARRPGRRPSAAVVPYISFVRGGAPLRALLGVSGGSCDVCTGMYTSLHPPLTSESESSPSRGFVLVAVFFARF